MEQNTKVSVRIKSSRFQGYWTRDRVTQCYNNVTSILPARWRLVCRDLTSFEAFLPRLELRTGGWDSNPGYQERDSRTSSSITGWVAWSRSKPTPWTDSQYLAAPHCITPKTRTSSRNQSGNRLVNLSSRMTWLVKHKCGLYMSVLMEKSRLASPYTLRSMVTRT